MQFGIEPQRNARNFRPIPPDRTCVKSILHPESAFGAQNVAPPLDDIPEVSELEDRFDIGERPPRIRDRNGRDAASLPPLHAQMSPIAFSPAPSADQLVAAENPPRYNRAHTPQLDTAATTGPAME